MRRQRFRSPVPVRRCPKRYSENNDAILNEVGDGRLDIFLEKRELKENEVILDYGCAIGDKCHKFLVPLAEKLKWKIYCVDSSDSMIQHAREKNPHPNVTYVHGSALDEDFELKGIKFDRIFCIHYLLFKFDDYKEEMKEMYKLLAPGGEMFVTTGYHFVFHEIFRGLVDSPEWGEIAKEQVAVLDDIKDNIYNPDAWKKTFGDMNLDVKEMTTELHGKITFPTPLSVAELWFAHNSYATQLPPKENKKLRDYYIEKVRDTETSLYKPGHASQDQEYHMEYQRVDVIFTK